MREPRDTAVKRRRESADMFPVDDPNVLRALCGAGDGHLGLIEDAFDVLLAAPGGCVTIAGPSGAREDAGRVLSALKAQVEAGQTVDEAAVVAAIHFARRGDAGAGEAGVIEAARGRSFRARTAAQVDYAQALKDDDAGLVFGVGPAGTGKTFLAVAYGAGLLDEHKIERLIVARPAVEAGEKLGYLPGDLEDKVDPYMLPIWDALRDSLGSDRVERRRAEGRIEVAPLAFMRGRTLSNAFVIIDEAQNATVSQMQMVLTRIGAGTRMAVTGDPSQVDLPRGAESGLAHALSILDGVQGVRAVRFTRADVVRHPLVGRIVEAYERDAQKRAGTT